MPQSDTPSSLLTRIGWVVQLYAIKAAIRALVFIRYIKPPPAPERPTYTKYYPVRPDLINHVWIPQSYKPGFSPLLPLLIDIHGGGFCIGHPTVDDGDNAILCHKHGICIVSINYRKAPAFPFPTAVEDVAALIEAVLDDSDLPVDKSRVAVAGYSAGGNLCLAAPQLSGLHKRIKGAVALYPVTDLSCSLKTKVERATPPPYRQDMLRSLSKAFNWAYIPRTQDLRNPNLSPSYASRQEFPEKLYILGCEFDLLCPEARDLAVKLADAETAGGEDALTKRELGGGRTGWQRGNVTWEELKGVEHGFNQRFAHEMNKKRRAEWQTKTQQMHDGVAEWLFREVYSD
jgi:acetyl esterase/lipase